VQITLSTDAPQAALAMSIAGLDLSNMSTETAAGSGAASGQIKVTAAPLSGTVTWACNG
jgi:hypothetical protein